MVGCRDRAGVETGAGDANDQRVVLEMGRGVVLIDLVEVAEGSGLAQSAATRDAQSARATHAIRVARVRRAVMARDGLRSR